MRKIIFDIETTSFPLDTFSESQQEYLFREAEKDSNPETKLKKKDEALKYLSLYPLTARVVAIGILDVAKERKFVYYESNTEEEFSTEDTHYKGLSECAMLQSFWRIIEVTDQVISFNGRAFDAPFLSLRSAIHRIKPAKNLIKNRYDTAFHIDLLDQFSYFGLVRKFNLDFYCRTFGIQSPKTNELNGYEVPKLYEQGRIKDIAAYCADDISATYELYKIWNEYLNFSKER